MYSCNIILQGDYHSSRRYITITLKQPTRSLSREKRLPKEHSRAENLFGLAPDGVYHTQRCYQFGGALLPHRFSFTCALKRPSEVYSLLHFPSACAAWTLSSILLYGARTFLSFINKPAIIQ